ncbi:MAG: hypothetical protein Q9174_005844, partial [Haloplaca sp. 1 TL-2023]
TTPNKIPITATTTAADTNDVAPEPKNPPIKDLASMVKRQMKVHATVRDFGDGEAPDGLGKRLCEGEDAISRAMEEVFEDAD